MENDFLKLQGGMHVLNERIGQIQLEVGQFKAEIESKLSQFIYQIEETLEGMKKEFDRASDRFSSSYIKPMNAIEKRLSKLEEYINDDRFHEIYKQINLLEEEFHQKAIKIITKTTLNKKGD